MVVSFNGLWFRVVIFYFAVQLVDALAQFLYHLFGVGVLGPGLRQLRVSHCFACQKLGFLIVVIPIRLIRSSQLVFRQPQLQ